jgi:hypothetical protein
MDPRVAWARKKAFLLYEGRVVPHRSCGIAMAETFGLATAPYQALRRGGLTGKGECGVVVAGRLVLGELFGDPDPAGPVTPTLRAAITDLEARVPAAMRRAGANGTDRICDDLTRPYGDFAGLERASFCTRLATEVATEVAEVILAQGGTWVLGEMPGEG